MWSPSTDDSTTDGDGSHGDSLPLSSSIYCEGEKVLSYHNKRIYEAKVLKVELCENKWKYFVHYLGWNKVWDEWVGVDRLLKHNEEYIMKQQTLDKKQSIDNNTKSGQLTPLNLKISAVSKGIKRKNDSGAEDTVSFEKLVMNLIPSLPQEQVVDYTEFVSRQDKGILGMDTGSISQNYETNKKGCRRHWTKREEDALLGILEDLVAKGHRAANRIFIPGTLNVIEKALRNFCPESGLKATPHIESKIKKLKKQFRIVDDMVNSTGFGWSNVKKCVKVNNEETWKAYLQNHKEAYGWKGKYFPLYERLVNIFKVDHRYVKAAETAAEIVEEMNCDEVNATDFGLEEDKSTTKQTDQSQSSQEKRRQDDTGAVSQIIETHKKGTRRVWTKEEEGALLGILEDLVAKGHRDSGTFKPGTLILIENALLILCPASKLKATPHVESKIRKLRKQHRVIYAMLSTSGFQWSDLKKCVEVENDETWKDYVQHHREADGWRDRYFPLYDRLVNIFGGGLATGKPSQTPVEDSNRDDEETNCDVDTNFNEDGESTDFETEEDDCSRSVDQISTNKQTYESHRRQDDDLDVVEMIKASNEQMRVVLGSLQQPKSNKTADKRGVELGSSSLQPKGNKTTDELRRELKELGLSITDRVKALRLLVANPLNAELFLDLDNEEKLEFVKQLVDESF